MRGSGTSWVWERPRTEGSRALSGPPTTPSSTLGGGLNMGQVGPNFDVGNSIIRRGVTTPLLMYTMFPNLSKKWAQT
jgi:hypothetical protein